ncbi:MAG: hypothetical protein KY445_11070, partial [Armatimonadetes bacterium]|nr:hypothetical protein [Armatimonadota bacterium]
MNIARSATLSSLLLLAAVSPSLWTSSQAAPSVPTLTFRVTARVGATGQNAGPQQTLQARVLLRGNAARVETTT